MYHKKKKLKNNCIFFFFFKGPMAFTYWKQNENIRSYPNFPLLICWARSNGRFQLIIIMNVSLRHFFWQSKDFYFIVSSFFFFFLGSILDRYQYFCFMFELKKNVRNWWHTKRFIFYRTKNLKIVFIIIIIIFFYHYINNCRK